MNDDLMALVPAFDRVSIRAVLVTDGHHPDTELAQAGIVDPIVVAVMVGEDTSPSGGILGDGITPNLTAVLETQQAEDPVQNRPGRPRQRPAAAQPARTGTTTLPAAYGIQSLAPVRSRGD